MQLEASNEATDLSCVQTVVKVSSNLNLDCNAMDAVFGTTVNVS